ncbi:MAG: cation:proton antiporter [Cycloclasticus sp.]
MNSILPILIATFAIATVINVIIRRFNMPTVLGYMFTGAVVGSIFDIHVHGNETLEHIAEFGIVFLMFTIGLEFSVSHLNAMKKEVFLFGLLQVVVTAIAVTIISQLLFDVDFKVSIIIGAGLALSSTAIVHKVLDETGRTKTQYGKNAIGILVFQDLAVIPILLMITIFTNQDKDLSELLISTAINAVIAVGILILIGKFVLARFFKVISNANSKEIYMGSILLTVVGASYIAHHFGFSYSLGAFIAGMMIADTIYKYQVEADLIPFRDLLLGVFFVSIGLQIDINTVLENIVVVVLLCIGVMFVKGLCIFSLLTLNGNKKDALKTAITLAQIGEFSLVVFSLLIVNQLVNPESAQIFMVVTILSMLVTPFLLNNVDKLANLVFKINLAEAVLDKSSMLSGHVILCGYGAFGKVVSTKLERSGINHIVLTNNTDSFVKAKEDGKTAVFGEPSDRILLERLKIKDAMNTILALDDFEAVKQASAAIMLIDPELKVIAKAPSEEEMGELSKFNHELLLDGNSQTASLLVDQINRSRLLAQETSMLRFLSDYTVDDPSDAIKKVEHEQARLLDIMSKSFNALREEKDIMYIKAFHDSFKVLSEIIGSAISAIMAGASVSSDEYHRLHALLNNQEQLISMNGLLESLGKELKEMEKNEKTVALSHMAVEGLDTILLTLMDIAKDFNDIDMMMLESMTSGEGGGLTKLRNTYLSAEYGLEANDKALLISATNHMDRLKSLFGSVGETYKTLAQTAS